MFACFVKLFFRRRHKKIAPFGAISLDSEVVSAVIVAALPVAVEPAVFAALFLFFLLATEVGGLGIGKRVGLVSHCLHDGGILFELGGIGREWKDHRVVVVRRSARGQSGRKWGLLQAFFCTFIGR